MAKSIIIVNNNLHIGGVQKSLIDFLKVNSNNYDITLCLFAENGEFMADIPENVKVISVTSLFNLLGISLAESKKSLGRFILRFFFALLFKLFGREFAMPFILRSQQKISGSYDYAISYLHNGGSKSFYGGCNEFVIHKIDAVQKIAFIHCDYRNAGSNTAYNNKLYESFDMIAACSYGCLQAFNEVLPSYKDKAFVVQNFHDFDNIAIMSLQDPVIYDNEYVNIVVVARLSSEKAIDRAIRALNYCLQNGAKARLHIVGDGILRNTLQDLAVLLKIESNVFFYGFSSNPYRFLKNSDLLLITSYHEAAPLVIDEARFLNIPIISVRTTSSDDMILSTNSGFVCENNMDDLQNLLYKITSNKCLLNQVKNSMSKHKIDNTLAQTQLAQMLNNA